jgi:hypothetical protein
MENPLLLDVSPCRIVELCRRFGGTCSFNHQPWRWRQEDHPKHQFTSTKLHEVIPNRQKYFFYLCPVKRQTDRPFPITLNLLHSYHRTEERKRLKRTYRLHADWTPKDNIKIGIEEIVFGDVWWAHVAEDKSSDRLCRMYSSERTTASVVGVYSIRKIRQWVLCIAHNRASHSAEQ